MTPQLVCPACGSKVKVSPRVTPGRAWLAMLPCSRCSNYAAYMIGEDGVPRAWVLQTGSAVEVAER